MNKVFYILTGNYGSGKTEIALNMALRARKAGKRVCLVDLDIVNPYFRSAERREMLEREGIRVLMPVFAMSTVDIPALPAEIMSVFESPEEVVVFDVGGDDTGAAALGVYRRQFAETTGTVNLYFVVNACRPLSQTAEDAEDLLLRVSERAAMRPTALINNTNLARETTPEVLMQGGAVVSHLGSRLGLPVYCSVGTADVLARCGDLPGERFVLTPYMRPEWLDI